MILKEPQIQGQPSTWGWGGAARGEPPTRLEPRLRPDPKGGQTVGSRESLMQDARGAPWKSTLWRVCARVHMCEGARMCMCACVHELH